MRNSCHHHKARRHAAHRKVHCRPVIPIRLTRPNQRVRGIAHHFVFRIFGLRIAARGRIRHFVQVLDLRIGAELLMHLKKTVFRRQLGDVAVGIIEITEMQGACDTG